jgi:hypothetical protein
MEGKSVKTEHLELVLTALAEHVQNIRTENMKTVVECLSVSTRSLDRLRALHEISDVLNDKNMTKSEKISTIFGIVETTLDPDMGAPDDWGYQ